MLSLLPLLYLGLGLRTNTVFALFNKKMKHQTLELYCTFFSCSSGSEIINSLLVIQRFSEPLFLNLI